MVRTTFIFAVLFIILGPIGCLLAGKITPTAFIPSVLGILLAGCAWLATRGLRGRVIGMHIAPVLALLGLLAVLGRLIPVLASGNMPAMPALVSLLAMGVLCAAYIVLSTRSFIVARSLRKVIPGS